MEGIMIDFKSSTSQLRTLISNYELATLVNTLSAAEQNGKHALITEAGFIDFIEDEVQADFPISTYHSYVEALPQQLPD
jgi:hypothetical protein